MSTTQPRRPPGTPTGGQYAPSPHARPSFELGSDRDPARDALAARLAAQVAGREAGRCQACDGDGMIPAPACQDDYDGLAAGQEPQLGNCTCGTCRGTGHVPTARDWAAAGVTDPEALGRLDAGGYRPEDLEDSPDRDLRLGAHDAAGTMVLDGELLSGAYQLRRHEPGLDPRRHFHHERDVYVGGEVVAWSALAAEDQRDYIDGYAVAAAGKTLSLDRYGSPAAAGYVRGSNAVHAARMIEENPDPERSYRIVDPDARGRRLVVTDVRPAPERGGYEARVAAGQWRRHHDDDGSRDVPWTEGARVFFTVDALGAT
ncbi:MAG: hypothetical protein M0Z42_21260 [Actinomycetota bacterium]|nr:hypothetical protein [Actinomycetota bacterium]